WRQSAVHKSALADPNGGRCGADRFFDGGKRAGKRHPLYHGTDFAEAVSHRGPLFLASHKPSVIELFVGGGFGQGRRGRGRLAGIAQTLLRRKQPARVATNRRAVGREIETGRAPRRRSRTNFICSWTGNNAYV